MKRNKPLMGMERSLWAALCLCGLSNVCAAQFAVESEEELDAEIELRPHILVQHVVVEPSHFDGIVFRNTSERAFFDRLETQLMTRLNHMNSTLELTSAQFRKLELAGRTDLKRLFDQIDAVRGRFLLQVHKRENAVRILQAVQPLQAALTRDPFDQGSLFEKTAHGVLTMEQRHRHERHLTSEREGRQRDLRERFIVQLDESIRLQPEQVTQLRELLAECAPIAAGPNGRVAQWIAASKLPEERYRTILNDDQWEFLRQTFARMPQKERGLRQNGWILFCDDVENKRIDDGSEKMIGNRVHLAE